ncbi:hypothetical protein WJX84_007080 [Apatococcus fuscideae]|uniref:Protein kinase domain-containing protein n=1 Tax=Apatococcus fuscideae TaxID=2026836 RepID=A0AAW1TGA3_9CHLO
MQEMPFPELTLDVLLGSGCFGKVWAGVFKGQRVAVKVMDWLSSNRAIRQNQAGVAVETELASSLEHERNLSDH